MGLCLFANNHVIDHAENRMIDQNKEPNAVYFAGAMRKGENKVGLLRLCQNVKFCMLYSKFNVAIWLALRPHCI